MGQRNRWADAARLVGCAAATLIMFCPVSLPAAEEAPPVDERGSDTLGTPEPKEEEAPAGPNRGRL